jgi:predicted transcriptional regulator of viral defense system
MSIRSNGHAPLYEVAESQAGYFTAKQAQQVGITRPVLAFHARQGLFTRVEHGIYRLTRFPASSYEDLFIAWLRTGGRGVVSHDSALALYDLSDALPAQIHLTIPASASRRRSGICLHTNRLDDVDVTRREGLPVTTVERTLLDVTRGGMQEWLIEQAIREALQRGLITEDSLQRRLDNASVRERRKITTIMRRITQLLMKG